MFIKIGLAVEGRVNFKRFGKFCTQRRHIAREKVGQLAPDHRGPLLQQCDREPVALAITCIRLEIKGFKTTKFDRL